MGASGRNLSPPANVGPVEEAEVEAREEGELEKDGGGPHLFFIHKLSHVVSQAKRKSLLRSFLMGNTIHTRYVLLHT